MDALKKPLRIPPDFSSYAEEKEIFLLLERLLQEVLVTRPEDPLQFMANYLTREEDDVPRVIVYGPPASGQHTVSKLAARKLKAVHIRPSRVVNEDRTAQGKEARSLQQAKKDLPPSLWADLLHSRLQQKDCLNKGWVLEGYPRTREQALALQAKGVIAKHFVHLEAPDSVLVERYAGKRIDSLTGDVYHLVFDAPRSQEVAARLKEEPGGVAINMHNKLELYHRYSAGLLSCYSKASKTFNADQPITDIFAQVYQFLCTLRRSVAPYTPRVVLLGPSGSGKSLQAASLARNYRLVDVDCRHLIRQTLVSGSKLAHQMKPFHEGNMLIPDDMVMQVLLGRLTQLDCASRGWVLHGFPLTRDQAELLTKAGYRPNRVFFLDVPEDSIKERLTLKRTDPVNGQKYHLLLKPPPTQEIRDRLQTHPRDTEEEVLKRLEFYGTCLEDIADYYSWGQHVNADQDPQTVFECIESMLVTPLPRQPPLSLSSEDEKN